MSDKTMKKNFKTRGRTVYRKTNKLSRGTLQILVSAIQQFREAEATDAAAAITYYALFSLFPLLLFLVAIGSSVLKSEQIQSQVLNFVGEVLPASQGLVKTNIQQVLRLRGAVSIVGTIGLLWSATAVFSILTQNINQAWRNAKPRGFLARRLMAVTIVGSLVVLLILSLISTTALNLLSQFNIPLWGSILIYKSFAWKVLSKLLPLLFMFIAFLLLYQWVPNTKVKWSEAAWGALIATIGWEIIKAGFTWYLSSGLVKHHLVYGSLGAVIALMLWIYLSSLITLFGAHLSAAITQNSHSKNKRTTRSRRSR